MKNNIGLKFAFRSTDIHEIKKTLEFFGLDQEDESSQNRLRGLENGKCLMQDLYGRVGVVQVLPVFEELFHVVHLFKREWSEGMKSKLFRIVGMIAISLCTISLLLSLSGTVAEAAELVDDTIETGNLYSQYSLGNYQLDFFVDSSWDWLPWNWGDGLGKSVMYGLYAIRKRLQKRRENE